MLRVPSASSVLVALAALCLLACGTPADDAPALVATPEVRFDRAEAAVSSPVEVSYRFVALPGAALTADYTVFVHFVDADGELMWTDDHQPPVPTTQWKPGAPVEYTRTMFIPKFPYEGAAYVVVGLYSPTTGERVKMDGEAVGQRAYRVATFNLRLQSDAPFVVFTEGWHDAEVAQDAAGVAWQWTRKAGTLAFKNPGRDAVLYLELDQPAAGQTPQQVDLRLGEASIDSFTLTSDRRELRKISIPKDQFGTGDTATIQVVVDRTFVPAAIPELRSADSRELGVRVFRAYLLPR